VVVLSAIQEQYGKQHPDWISTTVYTLKEMKMPPYLGLPQDQVQAFNKVINVLYPPSSQVKPPGQLASNALNATNPFFLKQQSPEDAQQIMELITNYLTFRYMPTAHLMAFMVLKAITLKKEDLDLVF
jgi:hypothetical protein